MVKAVSEGREPDPKDGAMGKQRSVHNTYFTLPVLFVMTSNHYAMTYGHRWSWLVLVGMTVAGALIRVWFVMRHKGRAPAWVWIRGVAAIAAVAVLIAPRTESKGPAVSLAEARKVIDARCVSCHSPQPTFQGIAEAPKGVMLDTPERINALAAQIHQQAVLTRAMPPGNLTQMTEEERQALARWYRAR